MVFLASREPLLESRSKARTEGHLFCHWRLDFLLDADARAWLLEVEIVPSTGTIGGVDEVIKTSVLRDVLALNGVGGPPSQLEDEYPWLNGEAMDRPRESAEPPNTLTPTPDAPLALFRRRRREDGRLEARNLLERGDAPRTRRRSKPLAGTRRGAGARGGYRPLIPVPRASRASTGRCGRPRPATTTWPSCSSPGARSPLTCARPLGEYKTIIGGGRGTVCVVRNAGRGRDGVPGLRPHLLRDGRGAAPTSASTAPAARPRVLRRRARRARGWCGGPMRVTSTSLHVAGSDGRRRAGAGRVAILEGHRDLVRPDAAAGAPYDADSASVQVRRLCRGTSRPKAYHREAKDIGEALLSKRPAVLRNVVKPFAEDLSRGPDDDATRVVAMAYDRAERCPTDLLRAHDVWEISSRGPRSRAARRGDAALREHDGVVFVGDGPAPVPARGERHARGPERAAMRDGPLPRAASTSRGRRCGWARPTRILRTSTARERDFPAARAQERDGVSSGDCLGFAAGY